jgi:hypothetical protein
MTSYRTFRKVRRVALERRRTETGESETLLGMIEQDEREAAARSKKMYPTVASPRLYNRARRPVHYVRRRQATSRRSNSQSDVEQPRSEVRQYPVNTLPETNW